MPVINGGGFGIISSIDAIWGIATNEISDR